MTPECPACSYPAPPLILGCTHGIPQISFWPVQGGIADPGDWPPGAGVVTPRGLLRRLRREPGTSQLGWEEPLAELPIRLALRSKTQEFPHFPTRREGGPDLPLESLEPSCCVSSGKLPSLSEPFVIFKIWVLTPTCQMRASFSLLGGLFPPLGLAERGEQRPIRTWWPRN